MDKSVSNFCSMEKQVRSLPLLLDQIFSSYDSSVKKLIRESNIKEKEKIIIFGSGDSNFAGLSSELAFRSFASISVEVLTSLKFSRYVAALIPQSLRSSYMAIGISVSGTSSRTREGIIAAENNKIDSISLTSNKNSFYDLASYGLIAELPEFPDPEPNGTPGVRSYFANHLMLILLAINLGLEKKTISERKVEDLKSQIKYFVRNLNLFLEENEETLRNITLMWEQEKEYVFIGSGPNYGSALFGAAKFIEATGDFAMAQETEEWAHLNFYNYKADTPTIILSSGKNDYSRTKEIVNAANKIGRKTLLVSSGHDELAEATDYSLSFPDCDENLSPLYFSAIFSLLASLKAELTGQTYFRENNTVETSKIRTSEMA